MKGQHWIDASGARKDGPCVIVIRKTSGEYYLPSDEAVLIAIAPPEQAAEALRGLRSEVDRLNAEVCT